MDKLYPPFQVGVVPNGMELGKQETKNQFMPTLQKFNPMSGRINLCFWMGGPVCLNHNRNRKFMKMFVLIE